jgi:catechol 2,3-dioxygenase-like lactoylglutathione lyase family enzyme
MSYRFHHLHLICKDLEQMVDFFTDALGARLVERKPFGGASGAVLDLNGTGISLRVRKKEEVITGDASQTGYGYDHIGLQVEDLKKAMDQLAPKGVKFLSEPVDLGDKWIVFFKGPEDITIELLQMK